MNFANNLMGAAAPIVAGVILVIGIISFVFVLGKKALNGAGEAPVALAKAKEMSIYGVGIAAVAVIWARR